MCPSLFQEHSDPVKIMASSTHGSEFGNGSCQAGRSPGETGFPGSLKPEWTRAAAGRSEARSSRVWSRAGGRVCRSQARSGIGGLTGGPRSPDCPGMGLRGSVKLRISCVLANTNEGMFLGERDPCLKCFCRKSDPAFWLSLGSTGRNNPLQTKCRCFALPPSL